MDFELRLAKEKWEREQREKKERARRERDREKKARDEAAKRQQAIEAAQSARRLEEAAAALAAQQREEEDLWLGDGIAFDKVLRAIPMPGSGDKIRLPPSAFGELSSQNAFDKGPMFFEVSVVSEKPAAPSTSGDEEQKSTHSGVLEFVAQEGYVELPPHVWHNAGLSESSHQGQTNVRVRYVRLPKGTYAKFRAEGLDFVNVPNHKAVLETKLRQHASLSVGDLLTVQHAGVDYGLRVMELKPSSSVTVLETDLEADVVGGVVEESEVLGASAQSRLVPLEPAKPQTGSVLEGQYSYFKFSLDYKTAQSVAGGQLEVLIHLDMLYSAGGDSDADIYVAAHPLLFPTQHNHEWSSHDKGSKVIVLGLSGKPVSAGNYSIGVHGFVGRASFRVLVEMKPTASQRPSAGHKLGQSTASSSGKDVGGEGYVRCENCRQSIPAEKTMLHEAYCFRHNVLCKHPDCGIVLRKDEMEKHVHCSKCGQALKADELDKHMKVFHRPLRCECGRMLEMGEMVAHKANDCPLRSITCRFCGDMVQAGDGSVNLRDRIRGLTKHESSCGSRTASCSTCGRSVMLKEMDLHEEAAHRGSSAPQNATMDVGTPLPPSSTPSTTLRTGRDNEEAAPPASASIQCPICERQFGGQESTRRLNEHIDSDHLVGLHGMTEKSGPTAMDVERGRSEPALENIPSATFPSRARTLSVSCPICGMAVHSERDLSFHIDMVH